MDDYETLKAQKDAIVARQQAPCEVERLQAQVDALSNFATAVLMGAEDAVKRSGRKLGDLPWTLPPVPALSAQAIVDRARECDVSIVWYSGQPRANYTGEVAP